MDVRTLLHSLFSGSLSLVRQREISQKISFEEIYELLQTSPPPSKEQYEMFVNNLQVLEDIKPSQKGLIKKIKDYVINKLA